MGKKQTVILYGSSLVIVGLATSLAGQPDLNLHHLNGRGLPLAEQLAAIHPDILIFDLAAGPPDNAFCLLWEQPQILLIGVDLNRHEIFQWAGQHVPAQTTQDVVHAIQRWSELKHISDPNIP